MITTTFRRIILICGNIRLMENGIAIFSSSMMNTVPGQLMADQRRVSQQPQMVAKHLKQLWC